MKSLVPKRYKSILMNLSKTVFFSKIMGRWKPLFSVSNFHIAFVDYNINKKLNPGFDFQIFIIKTDFSQNAINPLIIIFFFKMQLIKIKFYTHWISCAYYKSIALI